MNKKTASKITIFKKSTTFFLVLVFCLSLGTSFFPSSANAAIQNVSEQRSRTILYALIRCLKDAEGYSFRDEVSSGDIRNANNMENIVDKTLDDVSGRLSGKQMAVGYEIDSNDGNADCSKISLNSAMRPIDKTPRWFFEQIYDINNDQSTHQRRDDDTVSRIAGKLNQAMGGRDLTIGRDEKLRRLATAFWICGEEAPTPPDRETVTIGGKKYQKRSNAPDEVSVGYDMEDDNGKFRCDTLLNWDPEHNHREMAEALAAHPSGTTPGGRGGGSGGGEDPDCDTQLGSVLSWILCPVIDMATSTTNYIFKDILQPLLEDVAVDTNPNGPDSGAYKAWQGFRLLGNILLVGAMLILVYGAARGGR